MEELGIHIPAGRGILKNLPKYAREAEDAGFNAIVSYDEGYDALALAVVMAQATKGVKVATAIANIYLRHPSLTAEAASTIQELSDNRMILGLGIGHPEEHEPLGIKTGPPLEDTRRYVKWVRQHLRGEPPPPVYLAALRNGMARLAGEVADGVIFNFVPMSQLSNAVAAVQEGMQRRQDNGAKVHITSLLSAYISDDLEAARNSARELISGYMGYKYYRNLLSNLGYHEEIAQIQKGLERNDSQSVRSAISDAMVDEIALVGPPSRCRERLEAFRSTGVQMLILTNGSEDPAKGFDLLIKTFGRG